MNVANNSNWPPGGAAALLGLPEASIQNHINTSHLQWTHQEDTHLTKLNVSEHTNIHQVVKELATVNSAVLRFPDEVRQRASYLAGNKSNHATPDRGPSFRPEQLEMIKLRISRGKRTKIIAEEFGHSRATLHQALKKEPHCWSRWTPLENQKILDLHNQFGDKWDTIKRARTRDNPNGVRRSILEIMARVGHLKAGSSGVSRHTYTEEDDEEIRAEYARGGYFKNLIEGRFQFLGGPYGLRYRIAKLGAAWFVAHDDDLRQQVRQRDPTALDSELEARTDWDDLGQRLVPPRQGEHARLRWRYLQSLAG